MTSKPVNLNLIPLMRALLKHRSVTDAARSLGVSQSAASQGLAQLRNQMNDPLLVRVSGRMQLTPLATTLTSRIEIIAAELDDLFLQSKFDPRSAERTFVIAANDYMVYLFGRTMLDMQHAEAPGVRIHFIEFGPDYTERMAAQEIDFALLPRFALRDYTIAPLRYRMLHSMQIAALMDVAHPLATKTLIDEADLERFEHLVFHAEAFLHIPSKRWEPPVEVAPFEFVRRNATVRTNHFMVIPVLLRDTDRVAVVPYDMGVEFSRTSPTTVRKLSFGPSGIEHGIAWSPVFDADPAHTWFRTQVEARIAQSRSGAVPD